MAARILIVGKKNDFPNYEAAVRGAGGKAVFSEDPSAAPLCDGLLLPGGDDIDPARFGQENHGSKGVDPARDEMDFGFFARYYAMERPILGICRGHQVVNVALGGSLIQHIATTDLHTRSGDADKIHPTRAAAGGFLAPLYGTRFAANSSHHQAVDRLGDGLAALQWSEDGVVEGFAHRTLPILGVQWHPERMCFAHLRPDTVDGAALFRFFLGLCNGR